MFSTQTTFVRHTSRRGGRQSTLRLVLISGYPLVRRIWGRATLRGSVDRFEKKASPSVPYHPLAKGACSVSLFFFQHISFVPRSQRTFACSFIYLLGICLTTPSLFTGHSLSSDVRCWKLRPRDFRDGPKISGTRRGARCPMPCDGFFQDDIPRAFRISSHSLALLFSLGPHALAPFAIANTAQSFDLLFCPSLANFFYTDSDASLH